jgi:peroxiredoxin
LAIFVALRTVQTRSIVAGAAPAITAVALDGRPAALGAAAGKAQLLWFFATWCTVCQASEHNVRAIGEREDVVLIASDSGSDAALTTWLRAKGLERLRVVNDRDGAIARRFGVRSFPTTVAIAASGQVRSSDVGYSTELGLRWRLFRARH